MLTAFILQRQRSCVRGSTVAPVGQDEECRELKDTQVSLAIFSQFTQISVLGVLYTQQRMLGSGRSSFHGNLSAA